MFNILLRIKLLAEVFSVLNEYQSTEHHGISPALCTPSVQSLHIVVLQ